MSEFQFFSTFDELSNEDQNLVLHAQEASKRSYSPYSNYRVGAALLLENREVILGSNQENASYPAGLCAERVALFHWASSMPENNVNSIAVVAKRSGESVFRPVSPCGICRQVMLEYEIKQGKSIRVILQSTDSQWVVSKSAKNLLPFSFGQDSL